MVPALAGARRAESVEESHLVVVESMTNRTVLLTLGRLPVALDIARSFADSGWRVVVAETRSLHLCRVSRAVDQSFLLPRPQTEPAGFREALSAIIRRAKVDLVVPVSEETPYVSGLSDAQLNGASLFCRSTPDVLRLHDKLEFSRTAAGLGLTVPMSWPGDQAGEAAASGRELVVKPRFSCSGRGVRYHEAGELPPAGTSDVIQTRVRGELLSSCGICRDGQLLVNAIYRARVVSGSVAVAFERIEDAGKIEDWVHRFAGETKHTGFIAFDFIIDEHGNPQAIECNPRATSGIHFFAQGVLASTVADSRAVVNTSTRIFRSRNRLTEAYSCYTAFLGALPRPAEARRIFAELRAARDVTWRSDDPWPFLSMTVNSWPIIQAAMLTRRPFAEVAMADIEWASAHD